MKGVCIAERYLYYTLRGESAKSKLTVRVYAPIAVERQNVEFEIEDGTSGCRYEIEGLPESLSDTVYGADSLQALQLAVNIDGVLKSLTQKYDLYFPSGEEYFGE